MADMLSRGHVKHDPTLRAKALFRPPLAIPAGLGILTRWWEVLANSCEGACLLALQHETLHIPIDTLCSPTTEKAAAAAATSQVYTC